MYLNVKWKLDQIEVTGVGGRVKLTHLKKPLFPTENVDCKWMQLLLAIYYIYLREKLTKIYFSVHSIYIHTHIYIFVHVFYHCYEY